jgi:hypothetical protein
MASGRHYYHYLSEAIATQNSPSPVHVAHPSTFPDLLILSRPCRPVLLENIAAYCGRSQMASLP